MQDGQGSPAPAVTQPIRRVHMESNKHTKSTTVLEGGELKKKCTTMLVISTLAFAITLLGLSRTSEAAIAASKRESDHWGKNQDRVSEVPQQKLEQRLEPLLLSKQCNIPPDSRFDCAPEKLLSR
ncbi:hypothetical protein E2320_015989 [Naja naja]|nr:hypothetical protein E2320_015989 [Naja naja]